jgi:5S rRNA maturation endonuclease (ribonuclease M5)
MTLRADDIKRQAAGNWIQILQSVCRLTPKQLDPKVHGPCPRCGGKDRFRALDDVSETGRLFCNQCFSKGNGDGLAAIQWLQNCTFPEAVQTVADEIRSGDNGHPKQAGQPKSKSIHATSDKAADAIAWGMVKAGILTEQRKPDEVWRYRSADGSDAGAVLRWNLPDGRKEIRQVSCIPGGWISSAMPQPRPLLRLPEIIEADEIWIVEGEPSADAAQSLGLQATTSAGGSNAAEKTDWSPLDGKRVYILPDNDDPGEKFTKTVIGLIRRQAPNATVEVKRLSEDWPEILDGGDIADWSENFDSSDAETLVARLQSLQDRSTEYNPEEPTTDNKAESNVRSFAGKAASELWDLADQPVQWLVEDVISCDQPTIFGAKQKSLKTTLLTDLAVSLASGMAWLGKFKVPQPRRVLFVTGEASEAAAIRKVRRAAQSRNLRREDFTDCLRIEAITFPTLPSLEDCMAVASAVKEHGIEVVLLDPLYMGLQGLNTSNLTEVGPAMRQFMALCRPANVIIAHHVKKTASFDDAPNLEDLSQAGIAEFAGNYWLMGRMGEYTGDGQHTLAVRYGGRDEQFGLLKLQFDERQWTSHITSLMDHREDQKVRKETEKVNAMTAKILKELKRYPDGISEASLASAVGTKRERSPYQTALEELEQRKAIVCLPEFKAKNRTVCLGWKLAS